MKGSGRTTKSKVEGNLNMLMEEFIRENSWMIKSMELVL